MSRLKRKDKLRKSLAFFQRTFNFRPTYKVVVDADFLFAALKAGMKVYDDISKFFEEDLQLFTTPCVRDQIARLAQTPGPYINDWRGVSQILANRSNRFSSLRCNHEGELEGHQCLIHAVSAPSTSVSAQSHGDNENKKAKVKMNANKLILCAQHSQLRVAARGIPGVPIVFIQSNFLIIEDPSEASKKFAEKIKRIHEHNDGGGAETGFDVVERLTKFAPVKVENLKKLAEKLSMSTSTSGGEIRTIGVKNPAVRQKKKVIGPPVKNPNPLSNKKAKPKQMPSRKEDKKDSKKDFKRAKTGKEDKDADDFVQISPVIEAAPQPTGNMENGATQSTGKKRKRYKKSKSITDIAAGNSDQD